MRASTQHEVSAKVLYVIISDLFIQIILLEHHLRTYEHFINTFEDSGKIIKVAVTLVLSDIIARRILYDMYYHNSFGSA